jgi:hypothetical protein
MNPPAEGGGRVRRKSFWRELTSPLVLRLVVIAFAGGAVAGFVVTLFYLMLR